MYRKLLVLTVALVAGVLTCGGVQGQPPGQTAIVGSLSNFDVHQGCFPEADNFELDFIGDIDPNQFNGYFHGWGIPPRFDDIRVGSQDRGAEVLWLDRGHPIPYCNWIHFGVTVDPTLPPTSVQAYWTKVRKVTQIPVPFQWWVIDEQGILTDVLAFSETFDQGPVYVTREWAFATAPIPLEQLQFDDTPVPWMPGDSFFMYPGETRPLPLSIPPGAQAGLVRYVVRLVQNPEVMTRFVTEAALSSDRQFNIVSVLVNFDLHNSIPGTSFDNLELDFFGEWCDPSLVRWWYDLDQVPPPPPPVPAWGVDPLLRKFPAGLFPGMPGGLEVTWLDKWDTFDYCETHHFGLEFDPAIMQGGAGLYASDSGGTLYTIDHTTGVATPLCALPMGTTEIEYNSATGRGILQGVDGTLQHQEFDLASCAPLGPIVPNGWSFNGLEYVGGVLYGTGIPSPCGPSHLLTIDPSTGLTSMIGLTGLGPISGLAYDAATQTMFGVTGCHQQFGPAQLVTINLNTGVATIVGPTGVIALGSLEFGPDGGLYAIGANVEGGNFYRISPVSGAAVPIGPTGFPGFTGLTLGRGGQVQFPSVQAYWTQIDTCQVPVPWQFWRAVPGGPVLDIILLSDTWLNVPVNIIRDYAALPQAIPLDALTWDATETLPWTPVTGDPLQMMPGDEALLEIGYSGIQVRPDKIDIEDRAVYVRYRVFDEQGTLVSRFINEAEIVPLVPDAVPGPEPILRGSRLEENLPNPFNSWTLLIYRLEAPAEVTISIHDVSGRVVSEIKEGMQAPGVHGARWTAIGSDGNKLPAGVYLAVMEAGGDRSVRKVVIAE